MHAHAHTPQGDNFEEFDDARDVVASLSAEYEACESPDYVRVLYFQVIDSLAAKPPSSIFSYALPASRWTCVCRLGV